MEILGYIAAALIGISLGLIGGGGSILTIPVLVYIFHIDPTLAISYSLFIVGVTSLAGAYSNYRKRLREHWAGIAVGNCFPIHGIYYAPVPVAAVAAGVVQYWRFRGYAFPAYHGAFRDPDAGGLNLYAHQ